MSAGEVLMNRAVKLAAAGAATGAVAGGTINRARGGSFTKGAAVGAVLGAGAGTGLHFAKPSGLMDDVKKLYSKFDKALGSMSAGDADDLATDIIMLGGIF